MKLDCVALCTILLGLGAVPAGAMQDRPATGYYTDPASRVGADPGSGLGSVADAWIWLDAGVEPVLSAGDEVRVYFRSESDAFAAVFHLDTAGRLRIVFPREPGASGAVRGGRDYRVVFPDALVWKVNEAVGTGYFFLVASDVPLAFSHLPRTERGSWDPAGLTDFRYRDLDAAMDDAVDALLPEWESTGFWLTFLTYHLGEEAARAHRLCYDCLVPLEDARAPRPGPAIESRGAPTTRTDWSRPVLQRRLPGGRPPGG